VIARPVVASARPPEKELPVSRRLLPAAALTACLIFTTQVAHAAAGALDPTFGGTQNSNPPGIATTDLGLTGGESVAAMTLTGDQPIVVGTGGSTTAWFVARFNATDGYLDTSFSGDGQSSIDFGNFGTPTSVAVDSLGRIVVAGDVNVSGSDREFAVARFTSDGVPDTSFSGDGMQTIDFGSGDDEAGAVAIDSQDRVVVAGWMTASTGGTRFAVARLTTAGELDTSFSSDGKVVTKLSANDAAHAVTVDGKDRVVVAGWGMNGQRWDVARYRASGALDTSFSGDGFQVFRMGSSQLDATGIAIDSKARIVVGGYGESSGIRSECAAVRFTPKGAFDRTFAGDGIQFVITSDTTTCKALTLGPNDKPVMAGDLTPGTGGSSSDLYVVRLTSKGKRDGNFGTNGVVTVHHSTVFDRSHGIAVQSSGRIVVGADTQDGVSNGLTNVLLVGLLGS
jgi:uncharacterized delta-60 repeat protein